jgi:hypothetical protein
MVDDHEDVSADEDGMVDQNLRLSFRHDLSFPPSRVVIPSSPARRSTTTTATTARLPHTTRLLDMPLEVLQLCLIYATTPSFLQLIATCHLLWDLAANTRAVLLYHLAQVPGIKLGIGDLATATPDLFLMLRRRAWRHLFGAHLSANRTDYAFDHSSFDASASCLRRGMTFDIVLVVNDAVRLFSLIPEGLRYRGETLADADMAISQTAIDESSGVAVLYVQRASGGVAKELCRHGRFLMIYHKWVDDQYSAVSYPYLEGCDGYKATDIALSDRNMVAMVLSRGHLSRDADSRRANMAVVCHHLKHSARK